MNRLTAVASLALTLATAAAPAGAQTKLAYANQPIHVLRSSVDTLSTPTLGVEGNQRWIELGPEFSVSFVNAANVAATSVAFDIKRGAAVETIVDKGTFAPGASITHRFALASSFDDASSVEIRSVTFADGTTWQRGG